MFKDVAVCLGGILFLTSALAGECNVGEYANGDICSSCPSAYPHSVPNATGINDCYLITSVGKYVPGAGMAEPSVLRIIIARAGFLCFIT